MTSKVLMLADNVQKIKCLITLLKASFSPKENIRLERKKGGILNRHRMIFEREK